MRDIHNNRPSKSAFTLIELLVVIAVIAILIAVLLPAIGKARTSARAMQCMSRTRQLAIGWELYAQANKGTSVPGRFGNRGGGTGNPENWYDVGNGKKYRPRWAASIGAFVGEYAFASPSKTDDRQDYTNEVYACPEAPDRIDERNYGYGYNHQFLGNARTTGGQYHNFPVNIYSAQVEQFSLTVMFADSIGTAAGFGESERTPYSNDVNDERALSNHGWALDPPRLTDRSDRGTGDAGSPRTAVDPRHGGKTVAVFLDSHAEQFTPEQLGYARDESGRFIDDASGSPIAPSNKLFSGMASDDDPPDKPGS